MILVVVASAREWISSARALGLSRWHLPRSEVTRISSDLALLRTGVGAAQAERAAPKIVALSPDIVLHAGYAGALRAGLNAGDLLTVTTLSAALFDPDDESSSIPAALPTDSSLSDSLRSVLALLPGRMAQGGLLTVSRFIDRSEDKLRLGAHGHYVACDMEATVIRSAADRCSASYVGLRAISDASHHEMPPGLRDRGLRTVLSWARNPARASLDSWHMVHGWTRASASLERALPSVVRVLQNA